MFNLPAGLEENRTEKFQLKVSSQAVSCARFAMSDKSIL